MAQPPIVVDVRGMPEAITGINKATDALKTLESRLDSIQQSSQSVFQKVFGQDATKTFRRFVTDINRLSDASTVRFQAVADGLNLLSKAVRNLPKDERRLSPLIDDFQKLRSAIQGSKLIDQKQLTKIQQVFKDINLVFAEASTIKPIPSGVIRSISSLSTFFSVFERIGKAEGIENGVTNAEKIINTVFKLFDIINNRAPAGNAGDALPNELIKSLNSISKTISSLFRVIQDAIPADGVSRIDQFVQLLRVLREGIATVKPFGGDDKDVIRSINSIAAIVTAVVRLFSQRLDLGKIDTEFADRIQTFINKILKFDIPANLGKDGLTNVTSFISSLRNLFKSIKLIDDLNLGDPQRVQGILDSINSIQSITRAFRNTFQTVPSSDSKPRVAALMGVFRSVEQLVNFTIGNLLNKKLSSSGKLTFFLRDVSNILEELGKFALTLGAKSGQVSDEDLSKFVKSKVAPFAKVLRQLVSSLADVSSLIEKNKLDSAKQGISQVLSVIQSIAQILSTATISKVDPSISRNVTNALKVIVQIFDAIQNAFTFFGVKGNIFQQIGQRIDQFVGIRRFVGILKTVISTLDSAAGNIKNPENVQIIGEALKRVIGAIKILLQQIQTLPPTLNIKARIQQFFKLRRFLSLIRPIISTIAKSLGGFKNAGNIGEVGQAVSRIASAVKTIFELATSLPGQSLITRLTGFITFGFTSIGQILKIATKLVKSLKGLKNVNLTGAGEFFRSILDLYTQFQQGDFSQKVNKKGINNFTSFVDSLLTSAKKLRGVKIDKLDFSGLSPSGSGLNKTADSLKQMSSPGFFSRVASTALGNILANLVSTSARAFSGFIRNLVSLENRIIASIRNLGTATRQFGQQITQLGQTLLRGFNPLNFARSTVFKDVVDFDTLLKQFVVFGGEAFGSDEAQREITKLTDEIALRFGLNLNQSLEAALGLVKSGLNQNQLDIVLPQAAALAALDPEAGIETTARTLQQVATVFTQITETIPATFENIATGADILAAGADISSASIGSLSQGLENVGTNAREAGLSFEQTVAALVAFERAGKRGAEGGTALRSALAALNSKKARDLFESFGISFANDDGTIRSLDERIQLFNDFFERANATEAERAIILRQLADVEGATGIAILLANDGLSQTQEELRGLAAATDRAVQITDTFAGDVQKLRAQFQKLVKDTVRPLINNFLRPFVQFGVKILELVNTLPPEILETVGTMALLVTVVGSLVSIGLIAIGVITQFTGVLFGAGAVILQIIVRLPLMIGAFGAFAASAGILVVAIGAIVSGLILFGTIITQIVTAVRNNLGGAGDAFERFKAQAGRALEAVKRVLEEVGAVFALFFGDGLITQTNVTGEAVSNLFDSLGRLAERIANTALQFGELVRVFRLFNTDVGITSVDEYRAALARVADTPLAQAIFGGDTPTETARRIESFFFDLRRTIQRFAESFRDITTGVLGIFSGDPQAFENIKRGLGGIFGIFTRLISSITGLNFEDALLEFDAGRVGAGIRAFAITVIGALKNFILDNRDSIADVIATVLNPFKLLETVLTGLGFEEAATAVGILGESFEALVRGGLGLLFDLLEGKDLGEAILGNLGQLFIDLGDIFKSSFLGELGTAFQTGDFGQIISVIGDAISSVFASVIESIPTRLRELGDTLSINFLDSLADIIDFGFSEERFEEFLNALATDISNLIASLPDRLRELGTTLNLGFLVDIGNALDTDLFKTIADVIGNLATLPIDAFVSLIDGIKVFIDEVTNLNPVAVGVLGAVLFQLRTFILGLAGSAITTVLGPLAAVVTILSAVKAIGETLANIGNQNNVFSVAIDFVRNFLLTITDLISPLLELLGIDPNQARTAVDQALTLFGGLFNYIFAQLYALIGDFIAKINIAIADILASARISDPDQLNRIKSAFDSNVGQPLFDAIASSIGEGPTGSNLEALRSSLILNRDKIVQEALAIFNDPTALSALGGQERLNIFRVLEQAGLFDDVLGGLSDSQKAQFIESFANIFRTEGLAPELLGLDASATVDEIKAFLDSLNVNPLISESFLEIPIASRVEADQLRSEVETAIEEVEAADPVIEVRTEVLPPGRRRTRTGLEFLGGGFDRTPGRASGGKLQPYSTYEVHDTPNPEVATFADGRTLLFTGQAMGDMVNIVGRATAPAAPTAERTTLLARLAAISGTDDDVGEDEEEVITPRQAKQNLKRLAEQIADTIKTIQDNDKEARERDAEAVRKFNQERLRDLQDFSIARLRAEEDGQAQILDAVATRNAASARQAVEEQEKERRRAYEDQALEEARRQEDLRLERAEIEARRVERATELIAKLAEQREEERQMNEIIAQANAEQLAATQAGEAEQLAATQEGEAAQTAATRAGSEERSRIVGRAVADEIAAMGQVGDVATALHNYVIDVATKVQTALNNLGLGLDFGLKKKPVKAAPIQQGGGTGGGGSPLPTPFARGGFTPTGGLAMLHPREVVLPASAVRQPLSSNFFGGNRISNIINITVPSANMSADEIAKSAVEIIVPELTKRMERAAAD